MKFLSSESKLNAIDLLLEANEESEMTRAKIVEHFNESHKNLAESTTAIRINQEWEKDFYTKRLEDFSNKLDRLQNDISIIKEVIKSKDDLIDVLKDQLKKAQEKK